MPVDERIQAWYAEGRQKGYIHKDPRIANWIQEGVKKGYLRDLSQPAKAPSLTAKQAAMARLGYSPSSNYSASAPPAPKRTAFPQGFAGGGGFPLIARKPSPSQALASHKANRAEVAAVKEEQDYLGARRSQMVLERYRQGLQGGKRSAPILSEPGPKLFQYLMNNLNRGAASAVTGNPMTEVNPSVMEYLFPKATEYSQQRGFLPALTGAGLAMVEPSGIAQMIALGAIPGTNSAKMLPFFTALGAPGVLEGIKEKDPGKAAANALVAAAPLLLHGAGKAMEGTGRVIRRRQIESNILRNGERMEQVPVERQGYRKVKAAPRRPPAARPLQALAEAEAGIRSRPPVPEASPAPKPKRTTSAKVSTKPKPAPAPEPIPEAALPPEGMQVSRRGTTGTIVHRDGKPIVAFEKDGVPMEANYNDTWQPTAPAELAVPREEQQPATPPAPEAPKPARSTRGPKANKPVPAEPPSEPPVPTREKTSITKGGEPSATNPRMQQQSGEQQHPRTEESGTPAEPVRSNRNEMEAAGLPAEQQAPEQPATEQSVVSANPPGEVPNPPEEGYTVKRVKNGWLAKHPDPEKPDMVAPGHESHEGTFLWKRKPLPKEVEAKARERAIEAHRRLVTASGHEMGDAIEYTNAGNRKRGTIIDNDTFGRFGNRADRILVRPDDGGMLDYADPGSTKLVSQALATPKPVSTPITPEEYIKTNNIKSIPEQANDIYNAHIKSGLQRGKTIELPYGWKGLKDIVTYLRKQHDDPEYGNSIVTINGKEYSIPTSIVKDSSQALATPEPKPSGVMAAKVRSGSTSPLDDAGESLLDSYSKQPTYKPGDDALIREAVAVRKRSRSRSSTLKTDMPDNGHVAPIIQYIDAIRRNRMQFLNEPSIRAVDGDVIDFLKSRLSQPENPPPCIETPQRGKAYSITASRYSTPIFHD